MNSFVDVYSRQKCDVCGGPRYGHGFPMIRPISKKFGMKNLPIMFHCCSTDCQSKFMTEVLQQNPAT